MSSNRETIAHNVRHINAMRAQQAQASVTGGTCPTCGEGANPTIVEFFGHCMACQNATIGR